jgi:hypothetical protein
VSSVQPDVQNNPVAPDEAGRFVDKQLSKLGFVLVFSQTSPGEQVS